MEQLLERLRMLCEPELTYEAVVAHDSLDVSCAHVRVRFLSFLSL